MYIKKTDLAWLAGFTDGDGHVGCSLKSNGSAIQFAIGQNGDRQILVRANHILGGLGHITGPYLRAGRQPNWRFVVHGKKKVKQVTKLLWPWLGQTKRRQIRTVFKRIGVPY